MSTPEDRTLFSRRTALGLMLGAAGGAVLAACGSSAAPASGSPGSASSPKPAGSPRAGGTLRSAIPTDIPNVDPHYNSPSHYEAVWIAYDRLTSYDEKLQPQPMLAESWDVSSDYKQIKLNLRKGVQWHSGREFTSEDVKWNYLRVRDPKLGAGALTNQSNWWSTIDTPDKYTVVLKSDVPRPLVFDSFEYFNIGDRETLDNTLAKNKSVGTGPFALAEWVQGDHIRLVKNKSYWQSGRPYLDEILIKVLPDAQAMVAQLEAGSQDVIHTPPWRDFNRLKSDPKFQGVIHAYSGTWYTIGLTVLNKPLDNKLVRQALNFAMDRKRFTDTLLFGLTPPKTLPWLPNSPAYEQAKANFFAFDLDKAKALLAQAGVGNFETEMLLSPDFAELADFAQIFQADLAKIGVKLNIRKVESAAFFEEINSRKFPGMYAISTGRSQLQPGTLILSTGGLNPGGNNSGFKSDRYTELANAMAVETDAAKAKQIYSQLNDLLLDEAFCLALSSRSSRFLAKSNLHDVGYFLHDGFDWRNAWLS